MVAKEMRFFSLGEGEVKGDKLQCYQKSLRYDKRLKVYLHSFILSRKKNNNLSSLNRRFLTGESEA